MTGANKFRTLHQRKVFSPMRTMLLAAVICLATGAFAQTTTVTHGSGYCTRNFSVQVLSCTQMTNNDGTHWVFWFHYNPDGTFANGTAILSSPSGTILFMATNFAGSLTATGLTGTFSSGTYSGTDTEILGYTSVCHRGGCSYYPKVVSGTVALQ